MLHSVNFTTPELRHPRSLRAMPLASSDPGDLHNLAVKTITERGCDTEDCTSHRHDSKRPFAVACACTGIAHNP